MKRILVVMMCVIMAVCFIPAVAMAEGESNISHPNDNSTQCTKCVASVTSAAGETKYYDELTVAISEAKATDTVKLLDDVEYITAMCFDIDKKVTLDLNGKAITAVANGSCKYGGALRKTHFISIWENGDLTITDTSESKAGSITATYRDNSQLFIIDVNKGGKFTLDAGKVQNAASTNYGSSTVYVREGGTFILDGGTVAAVAAVAAKKRAYPVKNDGIMEMKNGLITSNDSSSEGIVQNSTQPLIIKGGNINVTHKVSISVSQGKAMPVINGGIFSGVLDMKWIAEGKYAVYDGTDSTVVGIAPEAYNACINQKLYFTGETGSDDAVKVLDAGNTLVLRRTPGKVKTSKNFSSGRFTVVLENGAAFDSSAITVAAGYKVASSAVNDNTAEYSVIVDENQAQARIGDTYYVTLGNANANAKDGDTIVVLKDITGLTSAISVSKELTIDLNGHSIQGQKAILFYDKAGAVIKTYTDAAKLTIIDSSNSKAGSVENIAASGRAVYADKGTVLIEAGSFRAATAAVGANDGAKLTVKAGAFTSDPTAYVPDGYVVLPSDKDGYAFMVGEAAATDVSPATGETQVAAPPAGSGIAEEDADNVKAVAQSTTAKGGELAAAANAVVGNIEEQTVTNAKSEYKDSKITGAAEASDEDIKIYAQTYLAITPTNYQDGNDAKLTLDIKPMYRVVASTSNSADTIVVEGEQSESEVANAVALSNSEKELTNIKTMTVSVTLPADFPKEGLKVKHYAKSGTYYYKPTVSGNVATFTVTNGFSPFEFLVDSRAATVQFSETDTRDYTAVNVNEALPTAAAPYGKAFGGWTFEGIIDGTYTILTDDLLTALATKGGTVTATPYFCEVPKEAPLTPLEKAKMEAREAVSEYVKTSEYEAAEQAEIKAIIEKAVADINNAKTVAEVKKIEAKAKNDIDKIETAAEKAIIRTIQNTKFIARSKTATLHGKKAIRVTWNKPQNIEFDGYEIFRSASRNKGYGTEPFFTTKNQKYTNNKDLEVGKTYYYRVRAYKYVNGQKVYTDYSTKAWRTVR